MEKKELKGMLAITGKEFKCFMDSTIDEIKELNPDLTDAEAEQIYTIIQPEELIEQ